VTCTGTPAGLAAFVDFAGLVVSSAAPTGDPQSRATDMAETPTSHACRDAPVNLS
jgi:hypothetical protein